MTLIKCKYCNEEVSDTAVKCVHCGKSLVNEEKKVCPDCNTNLKKGDKFCPNCGCIIKESPKKEEQHIETCPKCGAKTNDDYVFCENCGYNLKKAEVEVSPKDKKKNTFAIVGFILGLSSTLAWLIPIFGYPVTITGIVFSAKSKGSEKTAFTYIGLYFSIIFLVLTVLNSIIGVLLAMEETTYVDYIARAINYISNYIK